MNLLKQLVVPFVIFILLFSCKPERQGIEFTGIVLSVSNEPIEETEISINSEKTITDKNGSFTLRVPKSEDGIFLVTAHKKGYGLYSKNFLVAFKDKKIFLTKGTIVEFDPTKDIRIQDNNSLKTPFKPSLLEVDTAKLFDFVPKVYNSEGRLIDLGLPNEISNAFDYLKVPIVSSAGISLSISANSLVDESGNSPGNGTMLQAAVSTVDFFNPDGMPGDYIVKTKEGFAQMESFGAGTIEIFGGEKKYQLKKGAAAELIIPIYPVRIGLKESFPEKIPILYYNEKTGYWEQEGVASINATRDAYLAKVTHFSVINTDIVKSASAKCMKFRQQVEEGTSATPFQNYLATYNVDIIIPPTSSNAFLELPRSINEGDPGCVPWNLQTGTGTLTGKITKLHPVVRLPNTYIVYVFKSGTTIKDITVGLPGSGTLPGGPAAGVTAADCSSAVGCPANGTSTDCGLFDPNDSNTSVCNTSCWLSPCGFFPFENDINNLKIVAVASGSLKVKVKWQNKVAGTQGIKIKECTSTDCTTGCTDKLILCNIGASTACDVPGNPVCVGFGETEFTYPAAAAGTVKNYKIEIFSTDACSGSATNSACSQQSVTIIN